MTAPVFVDTNVFVYRFDSGEPGKQARAEDWLRRLWRSGEGRVSIQVLQELYVVLTRKLSRPLPAETARSAVRALLSWDPLRIDGPALETAWRLQDRYSLSWWDGLIVAAARRTESGVLLTEDLSHEQDLDGVRVIDPFRRAPGELDD